MSNYKNDIIRIDRIVEHTYHEKDLFLEKVEEILETLPEEGLMNPITVRQIEGGMYQLISGNHRLKACRILGWETIPCRIDISKRNKYFTDADHYFTDRKKNIIENRARKHYTKPQIIKMIDEEKDIYYYWNPQAKIDEKLVEAERRKAQERLGIADTKIEDPSSKKDIDYWKSEKDKAKKVIERTTTPEENLAKKLNISVKIAKQYMYLNELSKINEYIVSLVENSKVSEYKLHSLKRYIEKQENLDRLKQIRTVNELEEFVTFLESCRDANKINVTEVLEETNGIVRIGTRHYLTMSDIEYKVPKKSFTTRTVVKDLNVANATIQMLSIPFLEVLIVAENKTAFNIINDALNSKE